MNAMHPRPDLLLGRADLLSEPVLTPPVFPKDLFERSVDPRPRLHSHDFRSDDFGSQDRLRNEPPSGVVRAMPELPKPELQPMARQVKALRGKRSQDDLAYEIRERTGRKLTAGAISQIETGKIRPEIETMEAVAETLEVDPERFPEYRLARARLLLDERAVGYQAALENLSRLQDALRGQPGQRVRRRTAQARGNPERTRASPPSTPKRGAK